MAERLTRQTKKSTRGVLKTVLTTLDVVEYLVSHGGSVRLTDISHDLGYPKGRIHRILTTLASRNYVWRDPATREYSPGLQTWLLSRRDHPINSLIDSIRPDLAAIHQESQETVILSVLVEGSLVNLYVLHSFYPVFAYLSEGSLSPIHATSTGKAILTEFDQVTIRELVKQGLEQYTPYTRVDFEALFKDVQEARIRGYAVVKDEWVIGVSAVAACIGKVHNSSHAAITIAFPSIRATDEKIMEFGKIVKEKANEIRQRLGR